METVKNRTAAFTLEAAGYCRIDVFCESLYEKSPKNVTKEDYRHDDGIT